MKKICIGKIVAAHGVKGLVKILPFGDDPSLLEQVQEHNITLKNPLGKYILAEVDGASDRTAAEALKGTELHIARDIMPTPERGFHFEDLIGLPVEDEAGQLLGKVILADNYGASDLIEIQGPKGTFMLPFVDDYIIEVSDKIVIKEYEQFL